jgi:hypothetical protein
LQISNKKCLAQLQAFCRKQKVEYMWPAYHDDHTITHSIRKGSDHPASISACLASESLAGAWPPTHANELLETENLTRAESKIPLSWGYNVNGEICSVCEVHCAGRKLLGDDLPGLIPTVFSSFYQRFSSNQGGRAFAPGPITLWEEKKLLQFSRRIWGFSVKKLSALSADDPEHPCSALSANCSDHSLRESASLGRKARPHGADEPAPQHGRPPAFHIEPFVHYASDKDCYS